MQMNVFVYVSAVCCILVDFLSYNTYTCLLIYFKVLFTLLFSVLFIYRSTQNCLFYVICWLPAVMRWCQEMQPCAWLTALSQKELPATCWAPILCRCCCAMPHRTLKGQLCSEMLRLLLGSCVDLSPGALSPHSINHMLLITSRNQPEGALIDKMKCLSDNDLNAMLWLWKKKSVTREAHL